MNAFTEAKASAIRWREGGNGGREGGEGGREEGEKVDTRK